MPAGYNAVIDIYRIATLVDDVGGASVTGTLVESGLRCRLDEVSPNFQLLQQGMETRRLFTLHLPGTVNVHERDEWMLTAPVEHAYYSGTFRVIGVVIDSIHPADSRRHVEVISERITTSRRSV